MPEVYNELYSYEDKIGYERREIYENIIDLIKKNNSDYKILILGDSVSQWGTYADLFEKKISNEISDKNIEIVNAGVMGYDTQLEYNYLIYRGIDLAPNLVIIQSNMNDFSPTPIILRNKDGSWVAFDRKYLSKYINFNLFSESQLYQFIVLTALSNENFEGDYVDNVKKPLSDMVTFLRTREIPFYFIVFPLFCECSEKNETYEVMMSIIKDLKIENETIDLSEYYKNIPLNQISKDATHPNEIGDEIAAKILIEKVIPKIKIDLND